MFTTVFINRFYWNLSTNSIKEQTIRIKHNFPFPAEEYNSCRTCCNRTEELVPAYLFKTYLWQVWKQLLRKEPKNQTKLTKSYCFCHGLSVCLCLAERVINKIMVGLLSLLAHLTRAEPMEALGNTIHTGERSAPCGRRRNPTLVRLISRSVIAVCWRQHAWLPSWCSTWAERWELW